MECPCVSLAVPKLGVGRDENVIILLHIGMVAIALEQVNVMLGSNIKFDFRA
jgi:hypothetical protein